MNNRIEFTDAADAFSWLLKNEGHILNEEGLIVQDFRCEIKNGIAIFLTGVDSDESGNLRYYSCCPGDVLYGYPAEKKD